MPEARAGVIDRARPGPPQAEPAPAARPAAPDVAATAQATPSETAEAPTTTAAPAQESQDTTDASPDVEMPPVAASDENPGTETSAQTEQSSRIAEQEVITLSGILFKKKTGETRQASTTSGNPSAFYSLPENRGALALLSLQTIENLREGEGFSPGGDISLADGRRITQVVSRSGDSLNCMVDGQENPIQIDLQSVLDAHTAQEGSAILDQFPQGSAERLIIETRIKALRNPDSLPQSGTDEARTLDRALSETAQRSGLLLPSFARDLVAGVPEAQQTRARLAVERAIAGRTFLDTDTTMAVLKAVGFDMSRTGVENNIAMMHAALAEAQTPQQEQQIRFQIAQLKKVLKVYDKDPQGDPVRTFFDKLNSGEMDQTKTREIIAAVKDNDLVKVAQLLSPDWDALGEDEKKKRLELLGGTGKTFLGIFGLIAMIIGELGESGFFKDAV